MTIHRNGNQCRLMPKTRKELSVLQALRLSILLSSLQGEPCKVKTRGEIYAIDSVRFCFVKLFESVFWDQLSIRLVLWFEIGKLDHRCSHKEADSCGELLRLLAVSWDFPNKKVPNSPRNSCDAVYCHQLSAILALSISPNNIPRMSSRLATRDSFSASLLATLW